MNSSARRPPDYYLLWLVALISLGLNLYLLNIALQARRQVGDAAGAAAVAVGTLADSAIDYPVEIHKTLPISLTLDYKQTLTIPISVTLPISTEVTVPLRTPIGEFPITVPVVTTIPVRLSPQVPISVSLPVSTTVPVDVAFPIHVELKTTALGASLVSAQIYLQDLANNLGSGPAPGSTTTPTPR